MENPDSLLTAAKRLAEIAGMPWAAVQPYYKALQPRDGHDNDGWLPKSIGRNIWHAHPNLIARLIIALAASPNPEGAREAVEWARDTSPDGREFYLDEEPAANVLPPIEREFHKYLVSSEKARDLVNVEFHPDQTTIIFNTKSAGAVVYKRRNRIGEGRNDPSRPFRGIYSRGVIDGLVFDFLAKSINWRRTEEAPLTKVPQGEVDEDA